MPRKRLPKLRVSGNEDGFWLLRDEGDEAVAKIKTASAQLAHVLAAAPELLECAQNIAAWLSSDSSGADYGGLSRKTHPEGEQIWREWYDRQQRLCEATERQSVDLVKRLEKFL